MNVREGHTRSCSEPTWLGHTLHVYLLSFLPPPPTPIITLSPRVLPLPSLPPPPPLQAFLEGFWQLVPRELIAIFNDHELELLISGLPDIDVGDLRSNTQYSGYSPASPVIQWFWQVVAEMEKQDLALLLQFVTGG